MNVTNGAVRAADARPELITVHYRRLRRLGFGAPEAANLVALRHGLRIGSRPWTIGELTHLHFLRTLRRSGRCWLDADRRVAGDLAEGWRLPPPPRWYDEPSDGRITLESLFRAVAGPTARLDALAPFAHRQRRGPDETGPGGRAGL